MLIMSDLKHCSKIKYEKLISGNLQNTYIPCPYPYSVCFNKQQNIPPLFFFF